MLLPSFFLYNLFICQKLIHMLPEANPTNVHFWWDFDVFGVDALRPREASARGIHVLLWRRHQGYRLLGSGKLLVTGVSIREKFNV